MTAAWPSTSHDYYRRVTDVDIGEIAQELLPGRITQASARTLHCDCPNHASQSHRSLQIMLDRQGWYCHGCAVGGDVLQLVEFVQSGQATRGQSGRMPETHRRARDFLAARVSLPPLAKLGLTPQDMEASEAEHALNLRAQEALTAVANLYHERLLATPAVLDWFRSRYRISDATICDLKIGFSAGGAWTDTDGRERASVVRELTGKAEPFTLQELASTGAFRPTAQDGLNPFFDSRIVFPYWSRGRVVFMIGRRTPWTPDEAWEKSKYKKLPVHDERNNRHIARCINNGVLYNEDVLLTRPERVIITEGVTDCISLMEHGLPVVSPVTVQIREADWERLLPKLRGVKTVYICQDNEISEAGMQGALKTARALSAHGILTRVAVLPLGEKQQVARLQLRERFGVSATGSAKNLPKEAEALLADAKIDVNEFFAAGNTAEDFETILAAALTPLELAISKLSADTPDADLSRLLEPILSEIGGISPIDQEGHLRVIQARCGKARLPVTILRRQLKVVEMPRTPRTPHSRAPGSNDRGTPPPEPLLSVQVNNRQLRDIIDDTWAAIHHVNHPETSGDPKKFIFQKGGAPVRIVGKGSRVRVEPLDEITMYGALARSANWHKVTEEALLAAPPSRDAARDLLANPDPELPPLDSVIRTPTFGKDATLINTPGYHRGDGLWLLSDDSLKVPEVPSHPTAEQIAHARALLLEHLFVDFPFVRDADRAHAVAALLLPFMQRIVNGLAPIHLIEAPTQGSGKGLLAALIGIVSTGAPPEGRTLAENEDEVRKMITAELVTGRPIVLLDNLSEKRVLDSAALAAVVTVPVWTDRLLGVTRMLTLRNESLWLATGNNPQLSKDMGRRCIRIRIDPRIDMPWLRAGFKHPLIAEWAEENRSALVHAALTLIQAWVAAGRPMHEKRLGSFERWSGIMGGVLQVAGIPGFLGNLNELYEASDGDGQMWREFTGSWWDAYGEQPKKVCELNQFCESHDLMLPVRGDGSARSQQTRLGKALGAKRDRVFNGLVIRRFTQGKHKGSLVYTLTPADGGNRPDGPSGRSLSLFDSSIGDVGAADGDVGRVDGDVADKRPHSLDPIDPITYEGFGDVGDVGDVFDSLREAEKHVACVSTVETQREERIEETGRTDKNVPNVPKTSVIETKYATYVLGTFADQRPQNVPVMSPPCPDGRREDPIDLADLPELPAGDVGDVKEKHDAYVRTAETASEKHIKVGGQIRKNVPNVPKTSATETKKATYIMGTFGAQRPQNVPITSPPRPQSEPEGAIDLADLPGSPAVPGRDPP